MRKVSAKIVIDLCRLSRVVAPSDMDVFARRVQALILVTQGERPGPLG
jgi:hypothetical protein